MPEIMQRIVSNIVHKVSVVSPFKFAMSSVKIFTKMPGALSLESNQETSLFIIFLKSSFLTF